MASSHHVVVLASASPRRRQLLEAAGVVVRCVTSGVEERVDPSSPPAELALENAVLKVGAVAPDFPDATVLAADTVVWMEGKFFGKPADPTEALQMLEALSGRTHEVVTGVAIRFPGRPVQTFSVNSLVTFRQLGSCDLADYIASVHSMDKAGGYAAQEDNGRLIERIEGSLTNVIGLPMERLMDVLEAAG